MSDRRFDIIVIGAGQGGVPLAVAFARKGRTTAIIEQAEIGGTCINVGCTPTKTMVASARIAHLARRAADFGVATSSVAVDLATVRARKAAVVEQFRTHAEQRLTDAGVAIVRGSARFLDAHRVLVSGATEDVATLTAETIVINTGARPAVPPIPGLDRAGPLDSSSIMELDRVPQHLVVLGGGYVGLEFAQMFRRFGSAVTIVQRDVQLLPREDRVVADTMREILVDEGIDVRLETSAVGVEGTPGAIHVTTRRGDDEATIDASHILVATGRRPSSDALRLPLAGVETDREGFITVNDRLETTTRGIFAIGDVKRGPAFTHISYDDFRILRTNLIDGGSATTAGRLVPYTVFTDPQVASVGLTEREARAQGRRFKLAAMPMTSVARAIEMSETRGLIRVLTDEAGMSILGCTVVGTEAGEIMSQVQLAMMGGLSLRDLQNAIFAHPVFAEALNNLRAKPVDSESGR